jgi:ribonuclease VapC
MPGKAENIVLDSWSVLAFLQDEPAGKQVSNLITSTQQAGGSVLMTVVNTGEVWYILAREVSQKDADAGISVLRNIGVQFQDVDWDLTRIAAQIKARGRISYADAYVAALAKQQKCELVTGDPEFKPLEGEVKIRWV